MSLSLASQFILHKCMEVPILPAQRLPQSYLDSAHSLLVVYPEPASSQPGACPKPARACPEPALGRQRASQKPTWSPQWVCLPGAHPEPARPEPVRSLPRAGHEPAGAGPEPVWSPHQDSHEPAISRPRAHLEPVRSPPAPSLSGIWLESARSLFEDNFCTTIFFYFY